MTQFDHWLIAEIPEALIRQLKAPGRLVIPVGPAGGSQWLVQVDKDVSGRLIQTRLEGIVQNQHPRSLSLIQFDKTFVRYKSELLLFLTKVCPMYH